MTGKNAPQPMRAFGEENRARLLDEYFRATEPVSLANAWAHIYRLLLWTDPTTGLAHCYESDKSQPGRPWYERSLRFHGWVSRQLRVSPGELALEIDWLFRAALKDLAVEQEDKVIKLAAKQQELYKVAAFPKPGQDPELILKILAELKPWLSKTPSDSALQSLVRNIHEHTRAENKRKNLVGEGFRMLLQSWFVGFLRRHILISGRGLCYTACLASLVLRRERKPVRLIWHWWATAEAGEGFLPQNGRFELIAKSSS